MLILKNPVRNPFKNVPSVSFSSISTRKEYPTQGCTSTILDLMFFSSTYLHAKTEKSQDESTPTTTFYYIVVAVIIFHLFKRTCRHVYNLVLPYLLSLQVAPTKA